MRKPAAKFFFLLIIFAFSAGLYSQDIVFSSSEDAAAFAVRNSAVHILQKQIVLENMKSSKFNFQNFLPSFDFSLSEADNISMLAGDSRSKNFQASISQMIFNGGKNILAYDMGKINSLYAYNEYEVSIRNFKSEVQLRYYQYLLQKQLVDIKNELVLTAQNQLRIIEKEVELGLTLETDYLEYLISFIRIENEKEQSLRDLASLERNFRIVLGLSEQSVFQIDDNLLTHYDYFLYEPYLEVLWPIIKNNSLELRKHDISIHFSQKQLEHSKRWYVPAMTVNGGISFSGNSYPLTEPRYFVRLLINFSNNPLFPVNFTNGYGFEQNRLNNVNNSAEAGIRPDPSYPMQQKLSDLSIVKARAEKTKFEKDLYENIYSLVESHDNNLRNADVAGRMISLLEKRLEFSKKEVENGDKKPIDYLKELIELSQTKISFNQQHIEAFTLEKNLEILANLPFGGLKDVCRKQKNL
ncbi:MAG: TolC family protein [Treponema sp.]|jgi:hypothetical protein|nr:TolC family protein [Treponema sp.]